MKLNFVVLLGLLLMVAGVNAYFYSGVWYYNTTTQGYNTGCWTPVWNTTHARFNYIDYVEGAADEALTIDNSHIGTYYENTTTPLTDATRLAAFGLTGYTILWQVHSEDTSGNRTAAIWARNGAVYKAVFQVSTHDKATNEVYEVPDLYLDNAQPSTSTRLYCNSWECIPVFNNGTDFAIAKVVATHFVTLSNVVIVSPALTNTSQAGGIPNNNILYLPVGGARIYSDSCLAGGAFGTCGK